MMIGNYPHEPSDPVLLEGQGSTSTGTQSTGTQSTGSQSTGSQERAQQAAGTAKDEGKHVAGVAQGEAQKVASEAKSQVHGLMNQATSQVEDQSRTQRDRLVNTLRSMGDELEQMAGSGPGGTAADLVREVADRVRDFSSRVDGREPRELLEDVRSYARRKPGTFLLGALAAGVVAGRLTRGAKDASSGSSDRSEGGSSGLSSPVGTAPAGYGTAAGTPLAGTGAPPTSTTYPEGSVRDERTGAGGLPNPAGSVAGDTTWAETRTRGDVS